LLPLSKRLRRVTHDLANSSVADVIPSVEDSDSNPDEISEDEVSWAIRAWRDRGLYLPSELLSDPAWGMLLNLLNAEIRQERWTMSRLGKAAAVSTAAAIRWVTALEVGELAVRTANPHDSKNDFVELTPKAGMALRRYFRDVGERR
jgi:DNA-binding MarR family transcriptional regulator